MRPMKAILALVLGLAALSPSFADSVDFGGSLLNSTGLGNYPSIGTAATDPWLLQRDTANLWFQTALGENVLISAQVGAAFNTNPSPLPPTVFYVDADVLNLQATFPKPQEEISLFRFTMGRTLVSDFTGLLLKHKVDGFTFDFEYPGASLGFTAGYTGLVQKGASTISLSKADVSDVSNPNVIFAPPRLVETVKLNILAIPGQELTISGIFQQDMRDTALDLAGAGTTDLISEGSTTFDASRGGPVNTQYFGLGLQGGILQSLYYSLFSYLQTGQDLTFVSGSYQNAFTLAFLGGASLRYYLPNLLFSMISAKFTFVSGDSGATVIYEGNTQEFSNFTPISRPSLTCVFSPQLSNIAFAELSYSLKPLAWLGANNPASSLQVQVQGDLFFRPTTGAISESGIPAGNAESYLGTEVDLAINFRPLSDLGISLWGGVFFPGSAFGTAATMQFKSGVDVSLTI